jgi:hypothetical protein
MKGSYGCGQIWTASESNLELTEVLDSDVGSSKIMYAPQLPGKRGDNNVVAIHAHTISLWDVPGDKCASLEVVVVLSCGCCLERIRVLCAECISESKRRLRTNVPCKLRFGTPVVGRGLCFAFLVPHWRCDERDLAVVFRPGLCVASFA